MNVKGCKKALRALQEVAYKILIPLDAALGAHYLNFISAYRHVGSKLAYTMHQEVTTRCGILKARAKPMRYVFKKTQVSIKSKVSLAAQYVLSAGTLQCSTWPTLTPSGGDRGGQGGGKPLPQTPRVW